MRNSLAVRVQLAMAGQGRSVAPIERRVIADDGYVSCWCEECIRWVEVHVDTDVVRALHERLAHDCRT